MHNVKNKIMQTLYSSFYQLLKESETKFIRYLYYQIDWNNRLIAITGSRGVGKSTLLLQYIKNTFGTAPQNVLYVSLDHIFFSAQYKLYELGAEFVQQGGEYLFLDEVHKYENWSQEIKNLYDSFPKLKIVFTGSSMLEVYKGNADLSRRVVHYVLHGMSFREYLILEKKLDIPAVSLETLLSSHVAMAQQINEQIKPIPLFQAYLKQGYYPYYKENKNLYYNKLLNTINTVLETDLPSVEKIEMFSVQKIKKLLLTIAGMVPFTPNITDLSTQLNVSRNSVLNFLFYLEKCHIINLLSQDVSGLRSLAKPEKIYLNNTNLIYAFEQNTPNIGNIRESFFFNQLKTVAKVTSAKETDFTIDDLYKFEIGGKNKGNEQIMGLKNAYLALDNIEYGFANKIPLWLFGFLY